MRKISARRRRWGLGLWYGSQAGMVLWLLWVGGWVVWLIPFFIAGMIARATIEHRQAR